MLIVKLSSSLCRKIMTLKWRLRCSKPFNLITILKSCQNQSQNNRDNNNSEIIEKDWLEERRWAHKFINRSFILNRINSVLNLTFVDANIICSTFYLLWFSFFNFFSDFSRKVFAVTRDVTTIDFLSKDLSFLSKKSKLKNGSLQIQPGLQLKSQLFFGLENCTVLIV